MHSLQKTWPHLVFTGDLNFSRQIGHSGERQFLSVVNNTHLVVMYIYHHLLVNVLMV